jgi:pyruvate dehydrogenase (quinone)
MANKQVADVLVDMLVAAGVKRVYELVGDSLNGVTDSIRPRLRLELNFAEVMFGLLTCDY